MRKQLKQLIIRWKALFTAKREERKHMPSMNELEAEETEFEEEAETLKQFILKGKKYQKKIEQRRKKQGNHKTKPKKHKSKRTGK